MQTHEIGLGHLESRFISTESYRYVQMCAGAITAMQQSRKNKGMHEFFFEHCFLLLKRLAINVQKNTAQGKI
jgi:hypothetical protein